MKINEWELLCKIEGSRKWMAQCSCGDKVEVYKYNVVAGKSKRCRKCQAKRQSENTNLKTHGLSKKNKKLYNVWCGIKRRCYNPNQKSYSVYGAKGIRMCEAWLNDFSNFYSWAMEHGYREGLEIDRIDSIGNYEPSNCRFLTKRENTQRAHLGREVSLEVKSKWSMQSLGWSNDFLQEVIVKIKSGDYRAQELADILHVNRHTLSDIAKRHGFKTNWRRGVFTRKQVEAIRGETISRAEIIKKYNSNHETIGSVINKRGIYGTEYYI